MVEDDEKQTSTQLVTEKKEFNVDELKVSILMIVKDENRMRSTAQFLIRRGWPTRLLSQIEQAMEIVENDKPDLILISFSHPSPSITTLPMLLAQSFNAVCVGIAESWDPKTQNLLNNGRIQFKIQGGASGPNLHRSLRKILTQIHNPNASKEDAEKKNRKASARSGASDQIEIKGKLKKADDLGDERTVTGRRSGEPDGDTGVHRISGQTKNDGAIRIKSLDKDSLSANANVRGGERARPTDSGGRHRRNLGQREGASDDLGVADDELVAALGENAGNLSDPNSFEGLDSSEGMTSDIEESAIDGNRAHSGDGAYSANQAGKDRKMKSRSSHHDQDEDEFGESLKDENSNQNGDKAAVDLDNQDRQSNSQRKGRIQNASEKEQDSDAASGQDNSGAWNGNRKSVLEKGMGSGELLTAKAEGNQASSKASSGEISREGNEPAADSLSRRSPQESSSRDSLSLAKRRASGESQTADSDDENSQDLFDDVGSDSKKAIRKAELAIADGSEGAEQSLESSAGDLADSGTELDDSVELAESSSLKNRDSDSLSARPKKKGSIETEDESTNKDDPSQIDDLAETNKPVLSGDTLGADLSNTDDQSDLDQTSESPRVQLVAEVPPHSNLKEPILGEAKLLQAVAPSKQDLAVINNEKRIKGLSCAEYRIGETSGLALSLRPFDWPTLESMSIANQGLEIQLRDLNVKLSINLSSTEYEQFCSLSSERVYKDSESGLPILALFSLYKVEKKNPDFPNMTKINIKDLHENLLVRTSIFVHLRKNARLYKYVSLGGRFARRQIEKLGSQDIDLYISNKEILLYTIQEMDARLNNLNISTKAA